MKSESYTASFNGYTYKLKLDLKDKRGTMSKIVKRFSDKGMGSGHDGADIIKHDDGTARVTLTAYPGGPRFDIDLILTSLL